MPDKNITPSSDSHQLRQRAEKMLEEAKRKSLDYESSNTAELVHELQVHQIELEVQNEELRQSQAKLEESRARYADLYDFAPTGYLTLDRANLVIEANLTTCNMLGVDRADLLKKRISDYIASESQEDFYVTLREIRRTGAKKSCELKMIKNDKSAFFAQFESMPAGENTLRAAVVDISEHRRAKEMLARAKDDLEIKIKERTQELVESEEKYRNLVENANEVIAVVQEGVIKFFGGKALELTGYRPEDMINQPFLAVVHPDDRKVALETYQQYLTDEPVLPVSEFRVIRKDGKVRWVQLNAARITWEKQPAILSMFIDITELKVMEQELKSYSQKITRVQEEERKRIAYELHDDTAQYLSILKMQIGALANSEEIQSPKVKEKLQFLEKDANRAFNDVRRYSHELRPTTLEHQGLVAALEQIAEDFNKLDQMAVEVHTEGMEPDLSEEMKLGFFRIAQEALNNTRKHAKASQVEINIRFNHKNIRMIVTDNGEGFDAKQALKRSGSKGNLGLLSMRERADLINADLKIESTPGTGTRIILSSTI